MDYDNYLEIAIKAAVNAGEVISEIYKSTFDVEYKKDKSPLTLADIMSNETINLSLKETDIPVLSEEGKSISYEERSKWNYFWLVDPLDGTKEFVKKNGEFTVNIALIKGNTPILGVIFAPENKLLYFGSENHGSYKLSHINSGMIKNMNIYDFIREGKKLPYIDNKEVYKIVGSRSHMSEETLEFIESLKKDHKNVEIVSIGSSLKLCLVAEGSANIYPRFGPTMEWDTAAGHAIASGAGKKVVHTDMQTLITYNKENLLNPYFIVI